MGLFDKVCSAETHLAHPGLYATKNNGESFFNIKVIIYFSIEDRISADFIDFSTRGSSFFSIKYLRIRDIPHTNILVSKQVFWIWIANALIHSSLLYWLPLMALKEGVIWTNGRDGGYLLLGNFVYTVSVVFRIRETALFYERDYVVKEITFVRCVFSML